MIDKGFENLKELKDDVRNLYKMAFELQDRVSALEEAAEQRIEPDVTDDSAEAAVTAPEMVTGGE